jgi:large subunit ribosomal protein L19
MNIIKTLNNELIEQHNKKYNLKIPNFKIGDLITLRIIISKKKKRRQIFTGYCIAYRKKLFESTFTLYNSIYKEGVVKTFPLYSSMISNIQVLKK